MRINKVNKRKSYKFWARIEERLENCPTNKNFMRWLFKEMDKERRFGTQQNAIWNKQSLEQVIKDYPNSFKCGQ